MGTAFSVCFRVSCPFWQSNKEYHRKDIERNAWTEIGEKLGLEGNQPL